MRASGQDDWAGFVNVPLTLIVLAGQNPTAMSAPAVPHHIKTETGRAAEIRFKGQCLLLFVDSAEYPLNRKWTRPKFQDDVRVFEATRRELQACMKPIAVQPPEFNDPALAGASGLNPAKLFGSTAAIVRCKEEKPSPQGDNRTNNVNG